MGIRVRPMEADDLDRVGALWLAGHAASPGPDRAVAADAGLRLARWLTERHRDRSTIGFVAGDARHRVAGFVLGRTARWEFDPPLEPSRRVVVVNALVVDPDRRRQGIGRALADRIVAFARDAGASTVELDMVAGDAAAIVFWTALGFEAFRMSARLRVAPGTAI